jgi:hypothetical protein
MNGESGGGDLLGNGVLGQGRQVFPIQFHD